MEEKIEGEEAAPEQQEKPQEEVQDEQPIEVDHAKELEVLEGKKSERTELEKATYTARQVLDRIKVLGGNPEDLLPKKEAEGDFVTRKELEVRDQQAEARKLASSDDEFKHIMWYVENRNLTAEEAKLLANKAKLGKAFEEMKRAVKPPVGEGEGQRVFVPNIPELPKEEQMILQRSGYKLNAKGEWEGKFNIRKYDSNLKQWVTSHK